MTIRQLRDYRRVCYTVRGLSAKLDELILASKPYDEAGGNPYAVSDTVAEIVLKREKMRRDIESLLNQKNAVDAYLRRSEPYFAMLLRMHYVEGRTWLSIALFMGGGNTEDGIKKACYRYVNKNP